MVRAFFAALALAVGVSGEPPQASQPKSARVPSSVLALVHDDFGSGTKLTRVDPRTLKRSGRGLELATGGGDATALSPDRTTLAVAAGLGLAGVEFVDVQRMRSLGFVRLGVSGWVSHLFWQGGYFFAVVEGEQRAAVVTLDPIGRLVLERHRIRGTILHAKPAHPQRVVLLLAPHRGIGPLRLAVVGGKGMASTVLPSFVGGSRTDRQGNDIRTREEIPALVVDDAGLRAFVYARRSVAEISLRNLSVTQHSLSEPVSLLERFRNWLEPPAEAKLVTGYWREGAWLGDGRFAVTGSDYAAATGAVGAGLLLVDTRDWSVRTVDPDANHLVVAGEAVLSLDADQFGVEGYDFAGKRHLHVLRDTMITWLQPVGDLVYAHVGAGNRIVVIDPVAGRTLARTTTKRFVALVER
jgi:hypothetical protein